MFLKVCYYCIRSYICANNAIVGPLVAVKREAVVSKRNVLDKIEAAIHGGNSTEAIACLNELRRDHLDMYFVKDDFTQELINMFSKKWDKKHSQLWENIYTHFSELVVPHNLLSGMLSTVDHCNFWIYEAFAHAGAIYPTDNVELFFCAVEAGSWETVQKSLPYIQAEKYPEIFFLALRNSDVRVHENLYGMFDPDIIEKMLLELNQKDNVVLYPLKLPHNKSAGFWLRSSDKEVLGNFLSHQQKLRLLSHIKEESITHTRKM